MAKMSAKTRDSLLAIIKEERYVIAKRLHEEGKQHVAHIQNKIDILDEKIADLQEQRKDMISERDRHLSELKLKDFYNPKMQFLNGNSGRYCTPPEDCKISELHPELIEHDAETLRLVKELLSQ